VVINSLHALRTNKRFYILIGSILLSLLLYFFAGYGRSTVSITRLIQYYALTSIVYLYVALLIGPLSKVVPVFPLRAAWLFVRRALGVSACYFALLHAFIAFFLHLGGFAGLSFLNDQYIIAILLSTVSLLILTVMAATSFDAVISKLTYKCWKRLHQLVYLAGMFILIHALMLGSHFQELSTIIPRILFWVIIFLILLHTILLGRRIAATFAFVPKFTLPVSFMTAAFLFLAISIFYPNAISLSLNLHTKHQNKTSLPSHMNAIQTIQVDPDRFHVQYDSQTVYQANSPQRISFSFKDRDNPNTLVLLQKVYEKDVHLVITDSTLTHYEHIHPERVGSDFTVQAVFPTTGVYYGYLNYQPFGLPELVSKMTFRVGENPDISKSQHHVDSILTKPVNSYQVTLLGDGVFSAQAISNMKQQLLFRVTTRNGESIRTLKPYLGAFGHLVLINQDTYEYIHVHPLQIITDPQATGGPSIAFMPMNLSGTITPGIYRVFLQINPDNNLQLVDFTIKIE
jgi:DMSO/TMAO reductase YedYZ heme-binding membrane subunit